MRQKARRGELRRRLPAGFSWDEAGRIEKDPDEQVSAAIDLVFDRFETLGTIHQTHLSLAEDGVWIPVPTAFLRKDTKDVDLMSAPTYIEKSKPRKPSIRV